MRGFLATVALFALGFAVRFGWNAITAAPAVDPTSIEWAAQTDVWVEQELREGNTAAARGWLAGEGHATFEAHPDAVNRLIEAFYAAGAERVWMVAIEELGDSQISDTVAVELPRARAARDRIFSVEARFSGGERSEDVGQHYLTVSFD